ncbi:MAG: hypothetical protein NC102_07365 [Clostridium sp.]|nr:hypothetical protein [Clostridium sp.]
MESDRLRDLIVGKAFKEVTLDQMSHRLMPKYRLLGYENQELEEIASSQFGFSQNEFYQFCQNVMNNRDANTSSISELPIPHIGNGDIVEIGGEQGETLRLMKLQANDFFVLDDDTLDARPGDVMTMLQFAIKQEMPALMQLRRGPAILPSKDKAYRIGKVKTIKWLHSDTALYQGYLKSNSGLSSSEPTLTKAYADNFDLKFGGFAGPMLDADPAGKLYEIDLMNLTYKVNPVFKIESGIQSLRQELAAGFMIEEEAEAPTSIKMIEDGTLRLSQREGYCLLTCDQQAIISLC